MSTLFRGLGDGYRKPGNVLGPPREDAPFTFPAQVIDVCLSETHELYTGPTDIGLIRFKAYEPTAHNRPKFEEDTQALAWPLNRNIIRYPLPGEIVMVHVSPGDELQDPLGIKRNVLVRAFYDQPVSIHHNPTYNINPLIRNDQFSIRKNAIVSQTEAEQRFDSKIQSLDSYKESTGEGGVTGQESKVKLYKQLRPFEGDFILQGRFGNAIRFGSTLGGTEAARQPWEGGLAGDPIMILRVDRDVTTDINALLTEESINQDDATIMLCSSQLVKLEFACSELKSWMIGDPASLDESTFKDRTAGQKFEEFNRAPTADTPSKAGDRNLSKPVDQDAVEKKEIDKRQKEGETSTNPQNVQNSTPPSAPTTPPSTPTPSGQ